MNASSVQQFFSPANDRGVRLVLIVSGLLGFIVGIVGFSEWQVAVETAQVVAGIVQYPHDNPFYLYHAKLWTVLHQILAVLLKAGLSEKAVSMLLTGALGMLAFQGFAALILALSGDWLLAIGGAAAIFFTRPNEVGVVYPVWFIGSSHTYGVMAMSYMFLVIGLLGGGWRKSGALLLGFAPAVHPSISIWLGLIAGLSALFDIRRFRETWLPYLKYFLIGGGIAAISLVIQVTLLHVPKSPPIDAAKYFNGFVSFWDMHRAPVDLHHPGVIFNWWILILGAIWLVLFRKILPESSMFILRAAVVAAALALMGAGLSRISPERLPRALLMLMPSRLLNIPIIASLPLLIGVIGHYRQKIWAQLLLFALLVGLLFGGAVDHGMLAFFSSRFWQLLALLQINPGKFAFLMVHSWKLMAAIAIIATISAAISQWNARRAATPVQPKGKKHHQPQQPTKPLPTVSPAAIWLHRITVVWLGILTAVTLLFAFRVGRTSNEPFKDWRNNAVLAEAAKGKGFLLTGGDLHLVQLRTRRPVLLDGAGLDGMAYVVQAAPAMDQILKEVYQVDLFNAPEEARGGAAVPPRYNQGVWQSIPPQHWKKLAEKYGFTEVLTYAGWELQLPKVVGDEEHTLFRIP